MRAVNIEWDVDEPEQLDDLPESVDIPDRITDTEEISDYLSDLTGFCHNGYVLEDYDPDNRAITEDMVKFGMIYVSDNVNPEAVKQIAEYADELLTEMQERMEARLEALGLRQEMGVIMLDD